MRLLYYQVSGMILRAWVNFLLQVLKVKQSFIHIFFYIPARLSSSSEGVLGCCDQSLEIWQTEWIGFTVHDIANAMHGIRRE